MTEDKAHRSPPYPPNDDTFAVPLDQPGARSPSACPPVPKQATFTGAGPRILGPDRVELKCPKCKKIVLTCIRFEAGLFTWLLVGGICLTGVGLCGCCLIPLAVKGCKDVIHTCPECNALVGHYKRLSSYGAVVNYD